MHVLHVGACTCVCMYVCMYVHLYVVCVYVCVCAYMPQSRDFGMVQAMAQVNTMLVTMLRLPASEPELDAASPSGVLVVASPYQFP